MRKRAVVRRFVGASAVVIATGAAVAAVVGTALAGWAGWAFFALVCLLVADLGLGLVHAQLAALRQGA